MLVLLLLIALFGGLGFWVAEVFWFLLIAALVIWAIGFLVGGVSTGTGSRRWYRW